MYTIRPGYLIALRTEMTGGVRYFREDLRDDKTPAGGEETEWKTLKIVEDRKEHRQASLLRSKVSNAVRKCCVFTPFGLICPATDREKLNQVVAQVQSEIRDFNSQSRHTKLSLNVLPGRIAADDVEANRAIASEMRELAKRMKQAVREADVKGIREAALLASRMGAVLGDAEKEKVNKAVKAARDAARMVVKEVEKGGAKIEKVLPKMKLGPISQMRFAFLDTDGDSEEPTKEAHLPTTNLQRTANLDMED